MAPVPVGVPGAMGVLQPQAPALQPQLVDVPGKVLLQLKIYLCIYILIYICIFKNISDCFDVITYIHYMVKFLYLSTFFFFFFVNSIQLSTSTKFGTRRSTNCTTCQSFPNINATGLCASL